MDYQGKILGLICGLFLVGCASQDPIKLDSAAHLKQISDDQSALYPDIKPAFGGGEIQLTLEDAIDRALRYNLDARVAALETLIAKDNVSLAQFEGAPNITASGTFTRRNNVAASSSESILTGIQSLEPSTSSEKARRLADIQAQWNIMDSVIAYLDGKNAGDNETSAKERLRKVQQNIERDVINAYWQAYAGQKAEKKISSVSLNIATIERNIQSALGEKIITVPDATNRLSQLLEQQKQLNNLYENTALAKMELKAISALPVDKEIALETDPNKIEKNLKNIIKNKDINYFVKVALQNRPEMREQYMNNNIAVRGIERELLSSFPVLNLIYREDYDSNKFLSEHSWSNLSGAITQSITDFISLPTRYRAAENKKALEEERRKALTAAIIAQVHIAQIRIKMAEANYNVLKSELAITKKSTDYASQRKRLGAASGYDSLSSFASVMAKEIEKNQAFAELQKAYIDMIGTMGLSLGDVYEGKGALL